MIRRAQPKVETIMTYAFYAFMHLGVGTIEGVRAESYQAGLHRLTCVSYPEHTRDRCLVTAQHATREAAIACMARLLSDHFNTEEPCGYAAFSLFLGARPGCRWSTGQCRRGAPGSNGAHVPDGPRPAHRWKMDRHLAGSFRPDQYPAAYVSSSIWRVPPSAVHLGTYASRCTPYGGKSLRLSRRAWSRMAAPVLVYASQPPTVDPPRAGWFRNDWHPQPCYAARSETPTTPTTPTRGKRYRYGAH